MRRAVVQVSGGYDSSLSVLRAIETYDEVLGVFVDYGQRYNWREEDALRRLQMTHLEPMCAARGTQYATNAMRCDLYLGHQIPGVPPDYVPARNFVFAALMVNAAESIGAEAIIVGNKGAVAGGGEFQFPDAGAPFFEKLTDITRHISYDPAHAPRFEQNLLGMTKRQVIEELLRRKVELRDLWNCYEAGARPCHSCHHCVEMWGVLQELGLTTDYEDWWGPSDVSH